MLKDTLARGWRVRVCRSMILFMEHTLPLVLGGTRLTGPAARSSGANVEAANF